MNQQRKTPGRIRIVGGMWRGSRLTVADVAQLRPTPDRVRETLFNWLQNIVPGCICLDLFAGSGALGFEAASRGAAKVVMLEQDRQLVKLLQRQAETLHASMVEIILADAIEWLATVRPEFDVVFLDPPFGRGLVARSLSLLANGNTLRKGGLVYVEAEAGLVIDPGQLQIKKQKRAGSVQYMLLE